MRGSLTLLGNLLLAGSLLGLLGLGYGLLTHPEDLPALPGLPARVSSTSAGGAQPRHVAPLLAAAAAADAPNAVAGLDDQRSISRVALPRVGLSADVTSARLVERDGALTWEVPAFKVGHAEGTAEAGEPGNAVLLGHVTSTSAGDVFHLLSRAQVGDTVQVFAPLGEFDYTVVDVRSVSRGDGSVLEPGGGSAVSLITCTGVWVPTIWDYTERLVVRAELAAGPH